MYIISLLIGGLTLEFHDGKISGEILQYNYNSDNKI